MESPTGKGYVDGSSSYREDDARREIEEMALARARKALDKKFTGVDDLRADPNDPNFGDYNIRPGGNHP